MSAEFKCRVNWPFGSACVCVALTKVRIGLDPANSALCHQCSTRCKFSNLRPTHNFQAKSCWKDAALSLHRRSEYISEVQRTFSSGASLIVCKSVPKHRQGTLKSPDMTEASSKDKRPISSATSQGSTSTLRFRCGSRNLESSHQGRR